jgi:outer membrane receptor protein involved in Fe transport
MNSNIRMKFCAGGLSLMAFAHTGVAQNIDSSTTEQSEDDIYLMETFFVDATKDYGYVAVDSLAGGRVNTELKYTPSTVSSLTSAFIQDLSLDDVRDALKWTPNVVVEDHSAGKGFGGSAFHDWSFNYRSAGVGQQGGPGPTRNYFSFYQNPDTYNVDRIEVLRGPNSLVFGLGTVGGTLNVYTKRPHFDSTYATISAQVDSNGGLRSTLDYNKPITEKIAVRLNTVADNPKGSSNNDEGQFRALSLAVKYKPFESTRINFEVEYADKEHTLFGSNISDEVSGWDGVTASETWGAAPTGGDARTQAIQNAGGWGDWLTDYPVLISGLDNPLQSWGGGYASTSSLTSVGTNLNYQPYAGWYPDEIILSGQTEYQSTANIPVLPSYDWTYGNGLSEVDYHDFTLSLDQTINSNMDLSVSGYYYEDDNTAQCYEATGGAAIDINKQLPDGSDNPNYGKAFADFFLSKQNQTREVKEIRAQLNYHFDAELFGSPMKQLFSVSAAYKELKISARQYLAQTVDPSTLDNVGDWSQNMVWGRLYLDNPNASLEIPSSVVWAEKADGYWFDFDDTFKLKDVAAFSNTRLFDDKLSILAGVRYDRYDEHLRELRKGDNLSDLVNDESDSGTTYSLGGIYYLDWLGFFVNASENIQPPTAGTQSLLSGDRPGPEHGEGIEYGIRVSTKDNKYYASLTRYETKTTDQAVENPVALRSVWSAVYDAHPELDRNTNLTDLAYSDTTAMDVTGWEFEVTANPTKRIRLQASYAKPETSITDYYPNARKYVEDYLSEWTNYMDTADTDVHAEAIQNAISSVQDTLAQAVSGAIVSGAVKYTANIYAMYTFIEDDLLSGLSIGAGFSKTGRSYAATYDGVEYWGSSTETVNATVAYETEFFGKETRLAINVDNLFDNRDPVVTSYHWGYTDRDGVHVPDGYYIPDPRTITFTATVKF